MSTYVNNLETGSVVITDEVIESISAAEASKVEGVTKNQQGLMNVFATANSEGVDVNIVDKAVYIKINVSVEMGYSLDKICSDIQENVKETVENMTGLDVAEVNVVIGDISKPKKEKGNN